MVKQFEGFTRNLWILNISRKMWRHVSILANLAKSPSKPENVKMDVKELDQFHDHSFRKNQKMEKL